MKIKAITKTTVLDFFHKKERATGGGNTPAARW
jgi:hypothetical protein